MTGDAIQVDADNIISICMCASVFFLQQQCAYAEHQRGLYEHNYVYKNKHPFRYDMKYMYYTS